MKPRFTTDPAAAAWAARMREIHRRRRYYAARSVPLIDGRRDPLSPATDAPNAKWGRR